MYGFDFFQSTVYRLAPGTALPPVLWVPGKLWKLIDPSRAKVKYLQFSLLP